MTSQLFQLLIELQPLSAFSLDEMLNATYTLGARLLLSKFHKNL